MRDNKALMEKKGKKMINKMRNNKSFAKTRDKDGRKINSPKTQAKIDRRMNHSRSKMISKVKGGKKGKWRSAFWVN